ncbi:MAG: succinylglutamate-semialdehyde dehydrogenase [bacterium]
MSASLYINNQWVEGNGPNLVSTNPVTNQPVWTGKQADHTNVTAAINAAKSAFETWSQTALEERIAYVEKFTALLTEQKEAMTDAIMRETGKARWDAAGEAGAMIGKAAISIKAYHERTGLQQQPLAGAEMRIAHRPHGVMGVIGPYNFPAHLPNGHIVPALIAGNTIIFKPSEMTPLVADLTIRLWEQAGLPAGVINLVQGGRDIGEALVANHDVRGILFTGGVQAGTAIHKAMAGQPDRILALELGGNNPLIAYDIADKTAAAHIIIRSAYISSGQRCTCARRLIVPDNEEGQAIIKSVEVLIGQMRIGDPAAEPEPFMGSLISEHAAKEVLAAQDELLALGGTPIVTATASNAGPAFVTPALIDVTNITDLPDREVFGPLLQVIRVKNVTEAITQANNTKFGLAAGLISDNKEIFSAFIRNINAGIVNWNRQTTGASSAAPFGGVGCSGNHRPAGYYAADYCAWPMASLIAEGAVTDDGNTPGIEA